ncbi:MAG: hypothetical protein IPL79_12210 [Myxococcales bacterium]|nr:hypothetical protein [Myxococcales bacterium]
MRATDTRFTPRIPSTADEARRHAAIVVLALDQIEGEAETLHRAYAASRLLGATLEVMRVVDHRPRGSPHFAEGTITELPGGTEAKSATTAHRRATEAWVRDVLGQRRGVNVTTRDGDLAEEVTRIIRSLEGADLIVLGGQTGRNAELVTSLVIETKTAVLIGRGATSTETILAATNLERKECPELRSAARLTPQIDGELMAIHNVPPAYFTPERMWTLGVTPDVVKQACASKLEHAAARIGVPIEAVVCSESETKVAILSRARTRCRRDRHRASMRPLDRRGTSPRPGQGNLRRGPAVCAGDACFS